MEPTAWLNGEFLPWSAARLSLADMGLVHGATLTEMTRSFNRRWFRLESHLERLEHSLAHTGWPVTVTRQEWQDIAAELLARNAPLLPAGHELGLIQFVTAGQNLTYLGAAQAEQCRRPTVCCHTFPLPAELWASTYSAGQHLRIPSVRALPSDCIPASLKHRSRLHWGLADREVKQLDPRAIALLLDHDDCLTETASGNLFFVRDGVIQTPAPGQILLGISRQFVLELAEQLGLKTAEGRYHREDLQQASEAWTTSTTYALLPVTQFEGQPIGTGQPGPVYQQLLDAWGRLVGQDVVQAMRQMAEERAGK